MQKINNCSGNFGEIDEIGLKSGLQMQEFKTESTDCNLNRFLD